MSFKILSNQHFPITIPSATPTAEGVVTLNQVNTPGAFSALPLQNNFALVATGGVPQARLMGSTEVELAGAVAVPTAGTSGTVQWSVMPAGKIPSVIRFLATEVIDLLAMTPVPNTVIVDDIHGTLSGTPGAVVLVYSSAAGAGKVLCLDGLSFIL